MNHHLPPMPHGQPPMPPPRRQHDGPYSSPMPNMRSSPAYMGYHHPHPHPRGQSPQHHHPYPHQQYSHWPAYPQMPHPPPQAFQPYAPLIVSSHPRPQAQPPPQSMIPPPQPIPPQHSAASSTPPQSSFSSTPPPSIPPSVPLQPKPERPRSQTKPTPPLDAPARMKSFAESDSPRVPPSGAAGEHQEQQRVVSGPRTPFYPPLPWLSVPEEQFPPRAPRRRRRPRTLGVSAGPVQFPTKSDKTVEAPREDSAASQSTVVAPSELQTPVTSQPPSEAASTLPTTPSSAATPQPSNRSRPAPGQSTPGRAPVPVVPVVPLFPSSPTSSRQQQQQQQQQPGTAQPTPEAAKQPSSLADSGAEPEVQPPSDAAQSEASADLSASQNVTTPPARPAPKSWADLVRSKAPAGDVSTTAASAGAGGPAVPKSESLVDVLNSLGPDVEQYGDKIAFVEPRGLVNTGNMCYMNSILQALVFCVPFYEFLDRIGRRAVHSFRSEVPLIDAMILFMREFRVIDAATSVDQLRLRLKNDELEQYGESFIPEYIYEITRQLPRFRDMRRGHQQDAQEFLGFLLEELHEECAHAMKDTTSVSSLTDTDGTSVAGDSGAEGWLEVGHKQKPAVTRSVGHGSAESPITKIFGGNIRSEFRVPGNKTSVTLEPYQSIQLDIGSPQVNNVIDALKGLTKPETMHGDFNSSRGNRVNATKQVFLDSLPPVLILHLKRFQYDSATKGTQKIWKQVGYPLELDVPKEVFPPNRRNLFSAQGGATPKYRLIGVIYHHGKNATGGHYTVDLRRQDGREWIRIDDTVIRRMRSEDVAQAGSEEDPKVLAAALERQKTAEKGPQSNIYEQFERDDMDQQENERGWSQVNGTNASGHASKKSLAAVVNGSASPTPASGGSSGKGTPSGRFGARDNKVAYLLFYQRIN